MKADTILGAIVTGCLMVIAVSGAVQRAADKQIANKLIPITLPTYTPTEPMPVRVANKIDDRQLQCMALNLYFEARNQATVEAMTAIGFTVMNRVATKRYPDTICDVVFQGKRNSKGLHIRNKCQFSWACDGKADEPNLDNPVELAAWKRSNQIAMMILLGAIDNPIGNATMYHATYVKPYWAKAYALVAQVEDHIFYEKVVQRT